VGVGENVFTLYDMRGSCLSPALLLLCPGLGCIRGRIRACIPAIYLHSGPIAGGPVGMTIHGSGLTMTKNRTLFLLPKVWSSFNPPGSRCTSSRSFRIPGPSAKMALFLLPVLWGRFTQSWVFRAVWVWWDPSSSFVPSSFIFHRSKV
jgi:hypothetical protein